MMSYRGKTSQLVQTICIAFIGLATLSCQEGGGVLGSLEKPSTVLYVSSPTISYPRSSTFYSRSETLTIQGLCNTGYLVSLTGSSFQSTTCLDSSYSFTVAQTVDGIYPLMITQSANPTSTSAPTLLFWILKRSITAPTITSPAQDPFSSATNSISISGGCETGSTLTLSGDGVGTTTCTNSTYTLPVTKYQDGTYHIIVTQSDEAGNSAATSLDWQKQSLATNPGATQVVVGQAQPFDISGGAGGYSIRFLTNASNASIDNTSLTYTAGHLANVVDVLEFSDQIGNTLSVTITVVPDVPDHFILPPDSGSGESFIIEKTVTPKLKVQVVDHFDNPVANFQTSFVLASGDARILDSPIQATDSQGYAQVQIQNGHSSTRNQILVKPLVGTLPNINGNGDTQLLLTTIPTFSNSGDFGTNFTVGSGPIAILAKDFNSDGKNDIAVLNSGLRKIGFLNGKGNGLFNAMALTSVLCDGPNDMATGDINEDTKPDIVVACPGSNKLVILLSQADNTFATPISIPSDPTATTPISVRLADIDGDTHLDILSPSYGGSVLVLMRGRGDGTFLAPSFTNLGAGPTQLTIADFNHDNKLDAAVINSSELPATVSLLYGDGQGLFNPSPTTETAGAAPVAIEASDFNGDGYTDFVIANNGEGSIQVFVNDNYGAFLPATTIPVGPGPTALAVGDLNADNKTDILVTNSEDSTLSILIGAGDGSFDTRTPLVTGANPAAVAIADVNGDSHKDVLVAANSEEKVQIFLGNGTGTLGLMMDTNANPMAVRLADLDEDGLADLLVAQRGGNQITILKGNGLGFWTPLGTAATAAGVSDLTVGDLNHDGHLDFVIVHQNTPNARVFLGQGDGTFATGVDYATGLMGSKVVMADLNRDGHLDLAVANAGSNSVSILLNIGDGTFQAKSDYAVGSSPVGLAVADLNNDGELDLVTANQGSGDISILLSVGGATYLDSIQFAAGNGPNSIVVGHFNSDAFVDIAAANELEGTVSVFIGNGDGTMQNQVSYWASATPKSLLSTDATGDGKTDLVVGNGPAGTVMVLIGSGSGLFNTSKFFSASGSADILTAGDLNSDGSVDLIIVDNISAKLSTWLGH